VRGRISKGANWQRGKKAIIHLYHIRGAKLLTDHAYEGKQPDDTVLLYAPTGPSVHALHLPAT